LVISIYKVHPALQSICPTASGDACSMNVSVDPEIPRGGRPKTGKEIQIRDGQKATQRQIAQKGIVLQSREIRPALRLSHE